MGIPAFYRWLVERYPLSVVDVIEAAPISINGVRLPVDSSEPNPNGFEFDNLYLDMNGIIHPCFHPEGLPAPETYDDVFKAVFMYINRIFSIIRPRKLLYMAIDGVAPRAKMNQQRTRRFRTAKEASDEASGTERPTGIDKSDGENLDTKKLDSNLITPGTEFMASLSLALQYYIHLRMNVDPGWRKIKVILSDASVPGEGEHKIMSYIRLQRNLPGFDPNTRHCFYGLDADLIMLALATHEIHFSILREVVQNRHTFKGSGKKRSGKKKGQLQEDTTVAENIGAYVSGLKFQFVNIWVLRDYLVHDLRIPDPTVKADLERLVDDFVFMCLLVGNDFLPHVPSLAISEGAIDLLMFVYKKEFVKMGGYLTNSLEVNWKRVEHFVRALGHHENAIFRKRKLEQNAVGTCYQRLATKSNGIQKHTNTTCNDAISTIDKVDLGEEGWKDRYYTEKFGVKTVEDMERAKTLAVSKYVEGISWVMHYYYQGVCSWQWFYPYHYAPFVSDFHDLDQLKINFTLGEPFKPFDQLMGVLPAARKLMTDPLSPILDFYPTDFELDMNGQERAWQAVCKLPFIEESRLLSQIAEVEHTLTDEEKQRNSLGLDILFVHSSHPLAANIFSSSMQIKDHPKWPIDPKFSDGMNGYICISDKPVCPVDIHSPIDDMMMITKNEVVSVFYELPSFHLHIPRPPNNVSKPKNSVGRQHAPPPPILWHESKLYRHLAAKRHIPKSISGPVLAKLAHWVVLDYYFPKQQKSNTLVQATTAIVGSVQKQNQGRESNTLVQATNGTVGSEPKRKKPKKKKQQQQQQQQGGASKAWVQVKDNIVASEPKQEQKAENNTLLQVTNNVVQSEPRQEQKTGSNTLIQVKNITVESEQNQEKEAGSNILVQLTNNVVENEQNQEKVGRNTLVQVTNNVEGEPKQEQEAESNTLVLVTNSVVESEPKQEQEAGSNTLLQALNNIVDSESKQKQGENSTLVQATNVTVDSEPKKKKWVKRKKQKQEGESDTLVQVTKDIVDGELKQMQGENNTLAAVTEGIIDSEPNQKQEAETSRLVPVANDTVDSEPKEKKLVKRKKQQKEGESNTSVQMTNDIVDNELMKQKQGENSTLVQMTNVIVDSELMKQKQGESSTLVPVPVANDTLHSEPKEKKRVKRKKQQEEGESNTLVQMANDIVDSELMKQKQGGESSTLVPVPVANDTVDIEPKEKKRAKRKKQQEEGESNTLVQMTNDIVDSELMKQKQEGENSTLVPVAVANVTVDSEPKKKKLVKRKKQKQEGESDTLVQAAKDFVDSEPKQMQGENNTLADVTKGIVDSELKQKQEAETSRLVPVANDTVDSEPKEKKRTNDIVDSELMKQKQGENSTLVPVAVANVTVDSEPKKKKWIKRKKQKQEGESDTLVQATKDFVDSEPKQMQGENITLADVTKGIVDSELKQKQEAETSRLVPVANDTVDSEPKEKKLVKRKKQQEEGESNTLVHLTIVDSELMEQKQGANSTLVPVPEANDTIVSELKEKKRVKRKKKQVEGESNTSVQMTNDIVDSELMKQKLEVESRPLVPLPVANVTVDSEPMEEKRIKRRKLQEEGESNTLVGMTNDVVDSELKQIQEENNILVQESNDIVDSDLKKKKWAKKKKQKQEEESSTLVQMTEGTVDGESKHMQVENNTLVQASNDIVDNEWKQKQEVESDILVQALNDNVVGESKQKQGKSSTLAPVVNDTVDSESKKKKRVKRKKQQEEGETNTLVQMTSYIVDREPMQVKGENDTLVLASNDIVDSEPKKKKWVKRKKQLGEVESSTLVQMTESTVDGEVKLMQGGNNTLVQASDDIADSEPKQIQGENNTLVQASNDTADSEPKEDHGESNKLVEATINNVDSESKKKKRIRRKKQKQGEGNTLVQGITDSELKKQEAESNTLAPGIIDSEWKNQESESNTLARVTKGIVDNEGKQKQEAESNTLLQALRDLVDRELKQKPGVSNTLVQALHDIVDRELKQKPGVSTTSVQVLDTVDSEPEKKSRRKRKKMKHEGESSTVVQVTNGTADSEPKKQETESNTLVVPDTADSEPKKQQELESNTLARVTNDTVDGQPTKRKRIKRKRQEKEKGDDSNSVQETNLSLAL